LNFHLFSNCTDVLKPFSQSTTQYFSQWCTNITNANSVQQAPLIQNRQILFTVWYMYMLANEDRKWWGQGRESRPQSKLDV